MPRLRPCGVALAALFSWAGRARAQEAGVVLDRARVVQLAGRGAPAVQVAEARVGEARALRVGADVRSPTNPELSVLAGARFIPNFGPVPDVSVSLVWPFDFSGARAQRGAVANARTVVAEAEADDVRRRAVGEALDLWVRALAAEERSRVEEERVRLDEALVTIARARRAAGASGDGDLALATAVQAQGVARLIAARAEHDALLASLRGRLGLVAESPVRVAADDREDEPPPLDALLAGLGRRSDLVRSRAAMQAARADVRLQTRLGVPLPRFTINGAHDPEYAAHLGLDLPLPFYQHNQTATAVARAQVETATAEGRATLALAQADLRAAYATWRGALDAARALDAAAAATDDAERLATRGYELGETPLSVQVGVRRETAAARSARVEAHAALARARVALELTAGRFP